MIKVAVVGATGYTGEEIVNCLTRHDGAKITALAALVEKEGPYPELLPRFGKKVPVVCKNLDVGEVASLADVIFLALPHTVSMKYAPEFLKKSKKVIDLSADYRLPADQYEKWYKTKHADAANLGKAVYGLPEINRFEIKRAELVANPGCYPTSVILALLPIAADLAKKSVPVIVDSKSGVTGAGRKASIPLSFGEVAENLRCYKANEHQHMPEMEHFLSKAAGGKVEINFTPHLVPIRRGIMSTIYIKSGDLSDEKKLRGRYAEYYEKEPFVRVRPAGVFPEMQEVVKTNFCDIGLKVSRGMLVIVSAIDNLLKGAAGQAVQNMNIMCGMGEEKGLL